MTDKHNSTRNYAEPTLSKYTIPFVKDLIALYSVALKKWYAFQGGVNLNYSTTVKWVKKKIPGRSCYLCYRVILCNNTWVSVLKRILCLRWMSSTKICLQVWDEATTGAKWTIKLWIYKFSVLFTSMVSDTLSGGVTLYTYINIKFIALFVVTF